MKKPLVSIITISYNNKSEIIKMFPYLLTNTIYENFEFILINNGGSDNFDDLLKWYKFIKYIHLKKNIGFGRANNVGIKKAKGKYCVLLNPDTEPQKNWLTPIIQAMEKDKQIGIAGGICIHMADYSPNIKPSKFNSIVESPQIIGAYMVYRKKLMDDVGLFDPLIFLYAEDSDICYRTILAGYKVCIITGSLIFHGKSKEKEDVISPFALQHLVQNHLYLTYKYFGIMNTILCISIYILTILKNLVNINLISVKHIIKGIKNFIKNIKIYKRLKINNKLRNLKKQRIINLYKYIDPTGIISKKFGLYRKNKGIFLNFS